MITVMVVARLRPTGGITNRTSLGGTLNNFPVLYSCILEGMRINTLTDRMITPTTETDFFKLHHVPKA